MTLSEEDFEKALKGEPSLIVKLLLDEKRFDAYQITRLFLGEQVRLHEDDIGFSFSLSEINHWKNTEILYDIVSESPIITIDPRLDPLIFDTRPPPDSMRVPFRELFLNKIFEVGKNLIIIGIGLTYYLDNSIGVFCLKFDKKAQRVDIVGGKVGTVEGIHEAIQADKNAGKLMDYIRNFLNIMTVKDREVKIIERVPSKKKTNPASRHYDPIARNQSYITVGGQLKKYLYQYQEHQKRRGFKKSFVVRGHWRTFNSDYYKEKKGETIWVYPYVKGMDKELIQKFVTVKKGD